MEEEMASDTKLSQRSIQDRMGYNFCWGCGPANSQGLQIKSYWQGEEAVCTFRPEPQHTAGPDHILNGGIIATIIDCHCGCTAIAEAYQRLDREIGTFPKIWYATASLKVDYRRPTSIQQPVLLRARIKSVAGKKTLVSCELYAQDEITVKAEVLAVRVPETWFDPS
jgi:acyl-coenzyme A thioesterase PaaI-like protein